MNRGSPSSAPNPYLTELASMRPRFMNRGSDIDRLDANGHCGASMRPRFMNRGSVASYMPMESSVCRFNEAPIHESGKSIDATVSMIAGRYELQ